MKQKFGKRGPSSVAEATHSKTPCLGLGLRRAAPSVSSGIGRIAESEKKGREFDRVHRIGQHVDERNAEQGKRERL